MVLLTIRRVYQPVVLVVSSTTPDVRRERVDFGGDVPLRRIAYLHSGGQIAELTGLFKILGILFGKLKCENVRAAFCGIAKNLVFLQGRETEEIVAGIENFLIKIIFFNTLADIFIDRYAVNVNALMRRLAATLLESVAYS